MNITNDTKAYKEISDKKDLDEAFFQKWCLQNEQLCKLTVLTNSMEHNPF
jgi:hypothetical protein